MKKTFTTLFFVSLLGLIYAQLLTYTSNPKLVLKTMTIGNPKVYTGATRLEITSNLTMKLVIPSVVKHVVKQEVKIKNSGVKKVKESSYSPRQ